ncbi:MAG: hemerythrin domain-containing protein [Candidatus Limnocylindrales bacterium]
MTQSLPQMAHEHHERLLHHVDRMPALADSLLTARADEIKAGLAEMSAFLTGTLIPHVDAAERTMYPELERMFQNRHSMAPMRREHDEIRKLVTDLAGLSRQLGEGQVTIGRTLGVRRVMFQLYALLKVHLAEEDAYLRIVERGVGTDIADVLAAAMEHPVGIG